MKFAWTVFTLKSTALVLLASALSEIWADPLAESGRLSYSLWAAVVVLVGYFALVAFHADKMAKDKMAKDKAAEEESMAKEKAERENQSAGVAAEKSDTEKMAESLRSLSEATHRGIEKQEAFIKEWAGKAEDAMEKYLGNSREQAGVLTLSLSEAKEALKKSAGEITAELVRAQKETSETVTGAGAEQTRVLISQLSEAFSEKSREGRGEMAEALSHKFQEALEGLGRTMADNQREQREVFSENISGALGPLRQWTESQRESFEKLSGNFSDTAEALEQTRKMMTESAEHSEINQVEMKTSIDAMSESLLKIADRLEVKSGEGEAQAAFIEQLQQTLEAFHERATETLIENAVKTRELLSEVLQQKGTPA